MARKPRIYSSSGIYHIIMRGNNKQNLFHDDFDRSFFLQRLKKYSCELNIEIHAFCLMTNHVHILIANAEKNMSLLIQKLANSYVYYFNNKYERTGHLFQGRFKSEPILDDDYYKTVYRYILHNCEKANIAEYDKYKWNSYDSIKTPSFVNSNYPISLFGSKEILLSYISIKPDKPCMEYENKLHFSDEKALCLIKKLFCIESPYTLEQLNIDDQIQKCKILKTKGLSENQISRITGICKRIIKSA